MIAATAHTTRIPLTAAPGRNTPSTSLVTFSAKRFTTSRGFPAGSVPEALARGSHVVGSVGLDRRPLPPEGRPPRPNRRTRPLNSSGNNSHPCDERGDHKGRADDDQIDRASNANTAPTTAAAATIVDVTSSLRFSHQPIDRNGQQEQTVEEDAERPRDRGSHRAGEVDTHGQDHEERHDLERVEARRAIRPTLCRTQRGRTYPRPLIQKPAKKTRRRPGGRAGDVAAQATTRRRAR